MNGNWIKLYRSLLRDEIWKQFNPEYRIVFIHLLLIAQFKDYKVLWKGKNRVISKGQVFTSVEEITSKCGKGITVAIVRQALRKLEIIGTIRVESARNIGSIITICNYNKYQKQESIKRQIKKDNTTEDKDVSNNIIAKNKKGKNLEECKNIKNGVSDTIPDRLDTEYAIRLATAFPGVDIIKVYKTNFKLYFESTEVSNWKTAFLTFLKNEKNYNGKSKKRSYEIEDDLRKYIAKIQSGAIYDEIDNKLNGLRIDEYEEIYTGFI